VSGRSPDQMVFVWWRVRGPTNTHPVPFLLPVFWIFSGVVTEHFGNVTANHFAVFANELDLTSARLLRGKKSWNAHLYNLHSVPIVCGLRRSKKRQNDLLSGRRKCRASSAHLPAFRRKNRDRMCVCRTAHAPSNKHHLVRAAPRHPANVSHSQIEICQRSPFPDSSNRKSRGPAPPAWVPILWLTTWRIKTLGVVVGVTQWGQPPAGRFFVVHRFGWKGCGWGGCNRREKRGFAVL